MLDIYQALQLRNSHISVVGNPERKALRCLPRHIWEPKDIMSGFNWLSKGPSIQIYVITASNICVPGKTKNFLSS